jgi:hypothetical protein
VQCKRALEKIKKIKGLMASPAATSYSKYKDVMKEVGSKSVPKAQQPTAKLSP